MLPERSGLQTRVIGANGHLTGFGGGLGVKAWLLQHELQVRVRAR